MAEPVSESAILVPRDPSLDELTDEWPGLILQNASAHLPGRAKEIASVLEAGAGYPLTVIGQLDPLDEEDVHLYKDGPIAKRTSVVLDNVCTFSYGQYDDGSVIIWAAGKAGWFEINPSKAYSRTYYQMVDAIKTLWFVADAYKETRKKGKGKNATILPPYSPAELFEKFASEHLGSSNAEEGMEHIYAHIDFLMLAMLTGKEGLSWSKVPLYAHLRKKFPDVWAEQKRRTKQLYLPGKATTTSKSGAAKQESVETDSPAGKPKRARGEKSKRDGEESSVKSPGGSDTQHTLLLAAFEDAAKPSTKSTTAKATRRTRHNTMVEEMPQVREVATPEKDEETDEETRLRERKNKSSLRPRASKAAKGISRKGGKAPQVSVDDESASDSSRSPTAAKRKFEDGELPGPSRKRRNNRSHDDEGIDIPTSPSASGDAETPASPTGTPADLGELPLRTISGPDPVQEDTWTCALDDCTHKVYGASRPDSQRLIREHYALHAYDDDERVKMVKKLAAPSLPAGHLMERVRQQAKIDGFPASRQMSSRYPNLAVQQRY